MTSFKSDDMLVSLTYSAVRFRLIKGAIISSSELEDEMLITLDVRFFSFKSESLKFPAPNFPKFQAYNNYTDHKFVLM